MASREPFRLSRLRDVLLGIFAVFAGPLSVLFAIDHRWQPAIGAGLTYAVLIALARHPRMVFGISLGVLAIGPFTFFGPVRVLHAFETGHWMQATLTVVICGAVLLALGWFIRTKDWEYGAATTSDKIVVAGIVALLPVGLAVLLWYLKTYGLH